MNPPVCSLDLSRCGAREILDALADGAYITDTQRRILFWNQTAVRLTGWPASAVVGHACSDNILIHIDKDGHPLCGQEHCPLHRAMVTGEMSRVPLLLFAQHQSGRRLPVEVSVAPIRDARGAVVGGIEVFRDLTALMDDLRRARIIQDHALESPLPDDPRVRVAVRYTPEEIVGGDFYRLEQIDADRYAILVADVMGHGVAAALYGMQIRSLWEDYRSLLDQPARFVGELNRRLERLASADGYFATGLYLLFNAATGELDYVRAGHPAPLLFRSGGAVESLKARTPAIGLVATAQFTAARVTLAPGDTLLLYTDGAIEIANAAGALLGEEGFLALLAREGFGASAVRLETVEQRLLEYSQQIRLPDDLTLLSLRYA